MLYLLFSLDQDRYLLDVRQVAEVLPLIGIMPLPQAPPTVAGLFNYRGTLVPAFDLAQALLGRAARERLHTRIILAHITDERGAPQLLGLIAERVTDTVRREATEFSDSVVMDGEGLAHRIEVNQLVPAAVRSRLFPQPTPRS
jgi:chemotaxis-related protein WspB